MCARSHANGSHAERLVLLLVLGLALGAPTLPVLVRAQTITDIVKDRQAVIAQKLALSAAARLLNPYVEANQPVVRDGNTVFPHVNELPGPSFLPATPPCY